ncbi:MAG: outer membrane beta-barrel protein, partial [Desulfobacteraceae bacterium]
MSYHNDIRFYAAGMSYLLIFFLIFCLNVFNSHAAEVTLSPSISGAVRYDDNISFSRGSKENDFIFTITPGAELRYKTDKALFETGLKGNLSRYKEYDELDQNHYNINFGGNVSLSERFRLDGSASLIRDSTLDSELSETGIIT